MSQFKQYRRSEITELRPYVPGEVLDPHISISAVDRRFGCPKLGDMIARNSENPDEQFLVEAGDFAQAFEPVEDVA
jgi:hypothetical protein